MKNVTLSKLKKAMHNGEKIAVLTAYDASQAHWVSQAGVDVILVGDSLGMVVQGHQTTLPVSLDEMVYHTQMVQRGNTGAWCIADLPFMTDATLEQCLSSAMRLLKEGGANMVKLEGGKRVRSMVSALSELGVPVCCHLGLLPQSVNKNGYQVVGRDAHSATTLIEEAVMLEQCGAEMLVLECVPAQLAAEITQQLRIPVIGIGAGAQTSGQVLVYHDVLGLTLGKAPKFSHNFMLGAESIQQALASYVDAVKQGHFPSTEHEVS